MKRTITLILCLLMLLTLFSACTTDVGKSDNATDPTGQSGTPTGEITGTQSGGGSANTDGSIDLAVKPGEANGFIYSSKEGGAFVVNLPEGAFGSDTQLSVSQVTTTLDGIVIPGFTVTDKANPGAHVALSEPAAITLFSKEALPRDITIVKYSDDMTYCEAVPSIVIETDFGYFIMAEVDSFSSYGAGRPRGAPPELKESNGYFWRIEAENHETRVKTEGAESTDLTFYLRADSYRSLINIGFNIQRTYRGIFDMNSFAVSDEKALVDGKEVPMVVSMHLSDPNLKLTMIPNVKKASNREWNDYHEKLFEWEVAMGLNELVPLVEELVPLVPKERDGLVPLLPKPKPPEDIFRGYIGWGTAHLSMADFFTAVGGDASAITIDVPLVVRTDGVALSVSFVYPGMGAVGLKGTYKGIGNDNPAFSAPPELHDPALEYNPSDPFIEPPPAEGNPIKELKESADVGNTKIELPGGGWISITQPFDEDEEDEEDSIDEFVALWNGYLNIDPERD